RPGAAVTRERRRAVRLGDSEITLEITREGETLAVRFEGAGKSRHSVLASAWKPGDPIWAGTLDDRPISVKVHPVLNGFDLAHRLRVYRTRGEGGAADAGKEGCRLRQGGALPDARARGVDFGRGRAGGQGRRDAGGGRSNEDGECFTGGARWRGESNQG